MKDENGKLIKVHPYADRFPLMSDEELQELADDIEANGLKEPIVRDSDGTLIDGRNRLAACKLLKIKPEEIKLNGDDAVAFIVSKNLKRRNLKIGQQAMLAAIGLFESNKSQIETAKASGISRSRIAYASVVIKEAPDLIDPVLAGMGLDEAYEKAKDRKKDALSDEGKVKRLERNAPDLAEQVGNGKLTLTEALGALGARENEAREREKNRRETIYRVAEDGYRNIIAWAVENFTDGVKELLEDKEFHDNFVKRVRLNQEEIPLIAKGAKALAKILESL
jgi:ParB-like chromosome segregation protein Spo0J